MSSLRNMTDKWHNMFLFGGFFFNSDNSQEENMNRQLRCQHALSFPNPQIVMPETKQVQIKHICNGNERER